MSLSNVSLTYVAKMLHCRFCYWLTLPAITLYVRNVHYRWQTAGLVRPGPFSSPMQMRLDGPENLGPARPGYNFSKFQPEKIEKYPLRSVSPGPAGLGCCYHL